MFECQKCYVGRNSCFYKYNVVAFTLKNGIVVFCDKCNEIPRVFKTVVFQLLESVGAFDVFFSVAVLSMVLYIGSFLLTVYYSSTYLQQNISVLSFAVLIPINIFSALCFIPAIRRIVKLYGLFSLNDILGEIESANTYYDVQYRLIKLAKNTKELDELIEKQKSANEKFNCFLIASHIPVYKAIDLEKLFYSCVFPCLSDIAPSKECRKTNEIIKHVSALAEKNRVDICNFICNFSKFQKNPMQKRL